MCALRVCRRFVYLHRDPYEIFQSATHMADAYYWYSYLQRPTDEQITEWILWQYQHLYDRYIAARALIRPSHHMEIAFAELDAHPLQVLRRVYEHFEYAPCRVPLSSVLRARKSVSGAALAAAVISRCRLTVM